MIKGIILDEGVLGSLGSDVAASHLVGKLIEHVVLVMLVDFGDRCRHILLCLLSLL